MSLNARASSRGTIPFTPMAVVLAVLATSSLAACEGSEVRRPFTTDAAATDVSDADGADGDVTGGGSLDFQIVTATGPRGLGEESVVLVPEDEVADYLEVPGFQVDVEVQTTGVADGTDVKLFVDDLLIAPGTIAADETLAGTATFRGVTIPVAVDGVVVRFETEDPEGNLVVGLKQVKLDIGACKITASFTETDAVCVAPEVRDGKVGVPVHVQRDEGICETLGIRWELDAPGALGGILPDTTFDESGAADVFVELGQEGEVIAGTLTVHATAVHPSDENGNATVDVSTVLDPVAPTVAWVSPDALVAAVVGEADDVDPDQDGVQVAFTVSVDETADLRLDLDGVEAQTLAAVEAGEATFDAVTVTDGMVVTVTASDPCGNEGVVEATFSVIVAGSIAIVTPADGAKLLAVDDGTTDDPAVFDTTVAVVAPGAEVGATIQIACKPADADETVEATVVGVLVVDAVDPDGRYSVPIALSAPNLGAITCTADLDAPAATSDPVTFTVAFPAPTIAVTAPRENECVTSKTIAASGTTTGLVGRPITYAVEGGGIGSVAFVAEDGSFDGTFDLPTAAPDGDFTVSFDATDAWGNVVSDTQGPISVGFALDTADPVLALTAPAASSVGPSGDANPGLAGYQVAVTATLTDTHALGGRVCLVVNGGASTCSDVAGASVTFDDVTLTLGQNALTLDGTDACGNTAGQLTRIVTLVIENPLVVVTPADATTLLAAADGNPVTARVYETDFKVRGTALVAGAMLDVECRSGAGAVFATVGTLTVATPPADSTYTVPVAIDIDALGTSVSCRAKADLPAPSTSPEVALKVGLPAPRLAITAPAAAACVATRSFAVSGTSTALDGRTVTLSGATGTATVATGGAWSGTGQVSADGPVTLGASATDAFGNPAGAATVAFVVDATAPALALQAPTTSIDPDVLVDEDPVAPGYQTTVRIAATDAHLVGGQACYAQSAGAPVCKTLDATGVVTFAGVTFQVGDNALTLSGRDGCGTSAAAVPLTVTLLDNGDLTVVITTPAADLVTAANTLDFTVTVSDADGPISGATVSLTAGGAPTGVTAVDNGDGTYRLSAVAIPRGATTAFVASATRISRSGQSEPRTVTHKNATPTVTIDAPADAAVLNLASVACLAGQVPCVTDVTVTTTNAEDGSQARLTRTCGAAVATADGVVAGNGVTFAAVSLPSGGTCALKVDVTDAVGQAATDTNTVTIDRVAPTVSVVAPGDLVVQADDRSADAGIQAVLTVDLGGVEAGQVATAVLSWTEGGTPRTKSVTHTVATDTADGGTYVAAFEDAPGTGYITWPQGFVNVAVTVADLAGNSAADIIDTAVAIQGGVRITAPTDTASSCAGTCTVGICNDGACYRSWGSGDQRRVVAVVSDIFTTTNNVRVCSDSPSLAAAPGAVVCATAASATGPFYQILLASTLGGNTTLDLSTVLPAGFQRLVVEAQALAGGDWASSEAAVAAAERERRLFVDVAGPVVSNLGSPSDTVAPVGTLNKAELKGGVAGAYDLTFTSSEAAAADVFVNGNVVASQAVPAGTTTLTLDLPEGSLQIWVVLRDGANNTSPATPGQGALTYAVNVDFTAPTLAFVQPSKPILNAKDNLEISLSSDEEGGQVIIRKTGVGNVGGPLVVGGIATLARGNTLQVLINGTSELNAEIADAALNRTTAGPLTVLVDLIPPSIVINSPADGALLTDADDADPTAAGFQVLVDFTAAAGAQDWTLFVANGCDSAGNNCQTRSEAATGTVPVGGHVSQVVSVDITAATSYAKLSVDVTDVAANLATTEADIGVVVTSCQLSFTNLPPAGWYNIANTCPGAVPCASAPVSITVTPVGLCPPVSRIDLLDNGAVVGTHAGASPATFSLTVNDDQHLSLEARAYQGQNQVASTGVRDRAADFSKPAVSFVSRVVGGFTTAAEGASVTYLASQDLLPATAGMQLNASIDVADTHATGGRVVSATATAGSTVTLSPTSPTLPYDLTGTSPIRVDLIDLTIADGATHTIVVTAEDAAGNSDTATFTAAVDITGPSEVPITGVTITRRRPTVQLAFTHVGANGGAGGPVASYEVRYSPSPIDATNFSSACLATAPELLGSTGAPAPGTPGTTGSATFGGPDTRPFSDACKLDMPTEQVGQDDAIWTYWAIRAQDASGNWSPITTQAVRGIPFKDVWLSIDTVRIDNSGSTWTSFSATQLNDLTYRGQAIGDINHDGKQDFAFGSFQAQGFCVMLGHDFAGDESLTSPSGTNHICTTTNPIGAGTRAMGHHIAALGDINGDGIDDFGVSGRISSAASGGAVAIYLGRQSQLPVLSSPNIIVKGMLPNAATAYFGLCGAGDFDGVADGNGVKAADFVITAIPATAQNYVIVFPGKTTWTTATSLTIDVTVAGSVASNGGLVFNWSAATGGNFGLRCAPVGDVLPATPDGRDDFIVSQTGPQDARIFVLPGRTWSGGQTETLTDTDSAAAMTSAEDQRSVRLRQDNDTQLKNGFGNVLFGKFDFNNDGVLDIVVVNPNRSTDAINCSGTGCTPVAGDGKSIHIFDGSKVPSGVGQPSFRIGAPTAPASPPEDYVYVGTNGWIVRASVGASPSSPNPRSVRPIGDFNAWTVGGKATVDLAIANFNGNELSIRTNMLGGPKSFALATFPVLDGFAENINAGSGGTESIGTWVDGGWDMSGDSLPDLIAGSRKAQLIIVR